MKSRYNIIVFDLDDTLIDNLENVKYAFKKMESFLNKEYSDERFNNWYLFDKQFWTDFYEGKFLIPYEKSDNRYVPYIQSLRYKIFYKDEFDMNKALEINKLFLDSLKDAVFPIDGAYDTLNFLANKYTFVIATNGPKQAIKNKLDKINCSKFIKYIFSADNTKNKVTKPNRIYYEELLEYINCDDKSKILLVGDSLTTDVQGGMNSNIDTCWFNRNNEKLPRKYKPTMIITKLIDLTEKL